MHSIRDLGILIANIEREHEVSIHRHGGISRPPKPLDAKAEKLFGLVKRLRRGARPADRAGSASGGVCDGNNIAACGVPVVDTMGVRGGAIHSPEEFLIVPSLAERAALVRAGPPSPRQRSSAVTFRIRAATPARSPAAVRDGQAHRRRLHQPARRPQGADRQARPLRRCLRPRRRRRWPTTCSCSCSKTPKPARSAAPARLFSQVGLKWPFYSYRIGALTQHSEELGRTFRADMLNLVDRS